MINTKTIAGVAFFIFWTAFVVIVTAGLVSQSQGKSGTTNTNTGSGQTSGSTAITLTSDEIANHSTSSDCWIIISDKVYDVSSYLSSHPGGRRTVTPYCGKEATSAFQTKDQTFGRNHSGSAYALLTNYLLGNVGQTITQGSIDTVKNTTVPASSSDGEDGND